MHWTGHHQLDKVLGPLTKKLSFFFSFFDVKKLSFGNEYKVVTSWKQYRLAVGNYLLTSSFYVTRQYVQNWFSFMKQGNFRPNHVKASRFNRKLCSKHGPLYLWQRSKSKVVTTTNDWCNFGDIHCSKQIMTTHDPLYMIVLQALQSWPDAFCRFW